ncbi:MAG: hypothetical protein AAFY33_16275, partial [Cyanobacteria bacterium J06643_4]
FNAFSHPTALDSARDFIDHKGIEGLSEVEILSGIQPGEWVVSEGQNRLVEGTPVEIVNQGSVTSQDISSQFRSQQEAP